MLAIQSPSGVKVGLTPPLMLRESPVRVFITINSDADEPEGGARVVRYPSRACGLAAGSAAWLPGSVVILSHVPFIRINREEIAVV